MKKIIILAIIAMLNLTSITLVNAGSCDDLTDTISVVVTEKIPGACCLTDESGKITCHVKKGADQIVETLGNIIKYFTYIAGLFGVMFIVGNGIMYSMGGADQSLKDEAKKRIIGTLLGLVVLLLSGPILQIIAGWVYK